MLTFSLTILFLVSDLGLAILYLTPKCPSASTNPVNQLLLKIEDVSNTLFSIVKLYLKLINSINKLNLSFLGVRNLLCTNFIKFIIPSLSPIIYLRVLSPDF